MRFPLSLTSTMVGYIAKRRSRGRRSSRSSSCWNSPMRAISPVPAAAESANTNRLLGRSSASRNVCNPPTNAAPIVSICGGELMIYPEIKTLVKKILAVLQAHLLRAPTACSSRRSSPNFGPRRGSSSTSISMACARRTTRQSNGTWRSTRPSPASRRPRQPGIWSARTPPSSKDTDIEEIDALYAYLTTLDVDGFHALARLWLCRGEGDQPDRGGRDLSDPRRHSPVCAKRAGCSRHRMHNSPVYLEFLSGEREIPCTAWGNPTRNIKGWKGPCYLITDEHHASFDDLIREHRLGQHGHGNDPPRCEHCMVHSGFEASAALGVNSRLGDRRSRC